MEASDEKYEREEGRAIIIDKDCLQLMVNEGKDIELLGDAPLLRDQFQNLGGTFQSTPEPMWTFPLDRQSMVQDTLRKEDLPFTTVIVQEGEVIDSGDMYQPTTLASDEMEAGDKTSTAEQGLVDNPQSESTAQVSGEAMEISTTPNVNVGEKTGLDNTIPDSTGDTTANITESSQTKLPADTGTTEAPTSAGIATMLDSPPLLRHSPEPAQADTASPAPAPLSAPVTQPAEPHIVQHSTRSIALLGDTKPWTKQLNTIGGGKFKKAFKVGEVSVAGWTFPRGKLEEVKKIVPSATVIPITDVDKNATGVFSPKKRKITATEA